MALVKCRYCGQSISDKALKCPKCGSPLKEDNDENEEKVENSQVYDKEEKAEPQQPLNTEKSKTWIWVTIMIALIVCVILLVVNISTNSEKSKDSIENSTNSEIVGILADGEYSYNGYWESSTSETYPCKIEFVKQGGTLQNCSYTNLKDGMQIQLTGTIKKADELHFSGQQLVIDVTISSDGNTLKGGGIDYYNNEDKAKLQLTSSKIRPTEQFMEEVMARMSTYAGLTFRTFTEWETTTTYNDRREVYQSYLSNEQIVKNLQGLGFNLVDRTTESRLNYTGEVYYDVVIETYSKTVNGQVTTVKLDEDYLDIYFPNLKDVEKFEDDVRQYYSNKTGDVYWDNEEIYWAGTNVYFKGNNTVTLECRWEP